jgi:hypothetical protein
MYFKGTGINFPLRIKVYVKTVGGHPAIHDFHAADFDNAMPLSRGNAGGFGIQYYLTHGDMPEGLLCVGDGCHVTDDLATRI